MQAGKSVNGILPVLKHPDTLPTPPAARTLILTPGFIIQSSVIDVNSVFSEIIFQCTRRHIAAIYHTATPAERCSSAPV